MEIQIKGANNKFCEAIITDTNVRIDTGLMNPAEVRSLKETLDYASSQLNDYLENCRIYGWEEKNI